jgi:hypothetical protein
MHRGRRNCEKHTRKTIQTRGLASAVAQHRHLRRSPWASI